MVDQQLFSMGVSHEFAALSSPRVGLSDWAKEPDASWTPETLVDLTVVLEVGASESAAPRVAADARGWLENPRSTVKACVTIDLTRQNNLVSDVWQRGERLHRPATRNYPNTAIRVQHVQILHGEAGP